MDDGGHDHTLQGQKPPRVGAVEADEIIANRYRIVRFIAAGGMGEVWEAEDQSLHETVALKTLRTDVLGDDSLERFRREVKLARSVAHRHICRVFEFGEHVRPSGEKVTFLTMELLTGLPLADVIRTRGRLPPTEALPLLEQMASALDAAHQLGVVHRDFKSPNVFVEESAGVRRAVVTDFGLARSTQQDSRLTATRQVMGTPAFMAPEQVEGAEAGPPADLYALGVVAFELLTGALPFNGANAMAAAVKRLTEPPPRARSLVPDLPEHWDAAIARAMARRAEERFPTGSAFVAALRGAAPWGEFATPAIATPEPRASRRGQAILAGIVLALLGALGAWRFGALDRRDPTFGSRLIESTGVTVMRPTPEKKWTIDVPVAVEEREHVTASTLGLVLMVTRTGYLLGARGGILSGIPRGEASALDEGTLDRRLAEVKRAFATETSLVVVCQAGITRGECDRARIIGARSFPDQRLVEGDLDHALLAEGGTGFEVQFSGGLMPARKLDAEALGRLRQLYGFE